MKKIVLTFSLEILIPEGVTINQDNLYLKLLSKKKQQRRKRKPDSIRSQLGMMKVGETKSFFAHEYAMSSISAICNKTAKEWNNKFYFKTKRFKDGLGNIYKIEVKKF